MDQNFPSFKYVFTFVLIAIYQSKNVNGVIYEDLTITGGIQVRLYVPSTYSFGKLPLVVYYHGGGFLSGSTRDPFYGCFVQALVDRSNVIAFSVDYRLAYFPEFVSASYRDSWAALEYVATHSNGKGPHPTLNTQVDFRKIFLSGDSAGANIAHNMAMKIASDPIRGLQIKGIALFCPYFSGLTPIGREFIDFVGRGLEVGFWEIASDHASLDDTRINPLVDPKLPTLGADNVMVITGSHDPLLDRGKSYYHKLRSSGYKGKVYYGEYHGLHDDFIFIPFLSLGYSFVLDHASSFFNNA